MEIRSNQTNFDALPQEIVDLIALQLDKDADRKLHLAQFSRTCTKGLIACKRLLFAHLDPAL